MYKSILFLLLVPCISMKLIAQPKTFENILYGAV